MTERNRQLILMLLGAFSALIPSIVMWGFTVDDALISLRYANHLGSGVGYRFNALGPVTDGVTPLPWAPLLIPFAASTDDLVVALMRVKVLGIIAWTFGAVSLAAFLARTYRAKELKLSVIALLVMALAFPVGAYAASGMETGVATMFATLASISFERPRRAAVLAGITATLRPELLVWSVILAVGAAIAADSDRDPVRAARRSLVPFALATAPFVLCMIIRAIAFGRPAPLSLLAKPSDLQHGLVYAGAASLVVLMPLLAFAPIAIVRRASPHAKTLAAACAAHIVVVIAVGGDWMPYARLMVPIAPSLAIVFVDAGRVSHVAWSGARAFVAFSLGIAVAYTAAPAGRKVYHARNDLIAHARPDLASSHVIACADVGWIGAAAMHAEIVDLGGVTDPTVAILPGGHTSKAIDLSMLLDRNVDTIVIYGQPRAVENRLGGRALFQDRFEATSTLYLDEGGGRFYTIYKRR